MLGLNPITAKFGWFAYLVPFSVLDNIPKSKDSQSPRLLTNSIYIQIIGIADPREDLAMTSNIPGNTCSIKRDSVHHALQ